MKKDKRNLIYSSSERNREREIKCFGGDESFVGENLKMEGSEKVLVVWKD